MKQYNSIEKRDRSSTASQFWQAVSDLQFISSFFSWFFMLLSRLAEPCMLLAVLYVIIEAGIPQVTTVPLHTIAVAVMIAAPEIILPGAFVITRQAKEHGEENRPLLVICWLFVLLTLITLLSLFVLHLDHGAMSVIMCLRCGAGVGYSILVRMLSYKGLSINQESQHARSEQPAPFDISPELLEALRVRLSQTTISEDTQEAKRQPLALPQMKGDIPLLKTAGKTTPHTKRKNMANYERVKAYMDTHESVSVRDVAKALDIGISTANKWMQKVKGEQNRENERTA